MGQGRGATFTAIFPLAEHDAGASKDAIPSVPASRKSDHPIFGIALTGFGMEENLRRSHDVGFNHHLIKPVDLNRLDALIQQGGAVAAALSS